MRRRQPAVFALLVVGVVLSLLCSNAQASLVRRREAECDASLPLPAAAYVLGGLGLLFGLVALMLLARWFGQSRLALVLFATSIAAVVFELLVLITAIQAQSPSSVCGFPPPPGG